MNAILVGLVTVVLLLWYYLKKKTHYWSDRGVPFVKPELLIGNLRGITTEVQAGERWQACYNELKDQKSPIGGVFMFTSPTALVLDLDLLRNVFVKDFQHFRNHGTYVNEKDDPLSAHLFSIEDDRWKSLRTKLTPTFTSGKLKMMFPTIQDVAVKFADHLATITKDNPEVEFKELLAQFSTDVIGSTALGIECNAFKDPKGDIRQIAKLMFAPSKLLTAKTLFLFQYPELGRKLKMKIVDSRVTKFMMNLIGDIVKHREKNNVERNDFMNLLLQIKNTGRLEGEGETTDVGTLTFDQLAAQVFVFFFAGFETSSATMTFALFELARNPDVQEKARKEIKETIARHGGKMTYDAAMELTYIDQLINETLRKYPIVDTLFRKVSMPYKVPNTDVVLEKDTMLIISVLGIQRDPDNYPDPEKFDPERFTKENVAARHPYAFIPFGKGPRECIGMRFGMMQTRLGLATVLNNFTITPSKKTAEKVEFLKDGQVLVPVGGMYLNLKALEGCLIRTD